MPVAVIVITLLITIIAILIAKNIESKHLGHSKLLKVWWPIIIGIIGLTIFFVSFSVGLEDGLSGGNTPYIMNYLLYIGSFMALVAIYWFILCLENQTKIIISFATLLIIILGLYYAHNY